MQRDAKRAEIIDAAERSLVTAGYAGLSVVGVARELGIAQNSIHWYFPTKDALFVAVLRRRVDSVLASKPRDTADWQDQVVWFVDKLATHRRLISAMREHAPASTTVRQFQAEFDAGLTALATGALQPRLRPRTLPTAVTLLLSTIDGLLLRGATQRERATALRLLLRSLAANE